MSVLEVKSTVTRGFSFGKCPSKPPRSCHAPAARVPVRNDRIIPSCACQLLRVPGAEAAEVELRKPGSDSPPVGSTTGRPSPSGPRPRTSMKPTWLRSKSGVDQGPDERTPLLISDFRAEIATGPLEPVPGFESGQSAQPLLHYIQISEVCRLP